MSLAVLRGVVRRYPPYIWLVGYLADRTYTEFRDKCRYISGRLIDIGCGEKPSESLWAPVVSEHIGVDHEGTCHDRSKIDIFGSAYSIPVADASFDSAICTAVLEHLEEPELAIRECHRVLKPGGTAIYAVPFIWHLHEAPRDFFRFSKFGLEYLFTKVGFEIVELRALSGFWATFGQLLVYNLYRLNRGPLRWLRIIDALGIMLQLFAYCLDRIDTTYDWTWMYVVVARKKSSTAPSP
ncbi:MAG: class I SAM-dependent methyltransferase [Acidobacteria bacterium]|nr:class I SAM-dependent methyltransferase [Acidobacteriota bacterium]